MATVDIYGEVTGVKGGRTTVIAKTANDLADTCQVNVTCEATGVAITEERVEINTGQTHQLHAVLTPEDATDTVASWTSDNENVATVDSTGLVKGISSGTARISCTTSNGLTSWNTAVEVNQPATSIELDKNDITLSLDDPKGLIVAATVLPEDATNKNLGVSIADESLCSARIIEINKIHFTPKVKTGTTTATIYIIDENGKVEGSPEAVVTINVIEKIVKPSLTLVLPNGAVKMTSLKEGDKLQILADEGYGISTATLDSDDITAEISPEGFFTLPELKENSVLNVVFSAQTSVNGTKASQTIKVYADGTTVRVKGASANATVKIYSASGACVYSGTKTEVSLTAHGVYVLIVDGQKFKFAI